MNVTRPARAAVVASAFAVVLVSATPSAAEARTVEEFDVSFSETACAGTEVLAELHVRLTDKERPDGTIQHWLDISGTLTSAADVVSLQAHRRYTDDPSADSSSFAGLQSRFASPGEGVLALNAGWASGALSESIATYAVRGRWDFRGHGLPPSVCQALAS